MRIKIWIVLLIVCFSLNLFAGVYGKIEIGKPIGNSTYKLNGYVTENYANTFFTNMVMGYKNYIFNSGVEYNIYSGIFTWSEHNGIYGKPFEDIYGIGGRLKYKGFYTQLNHFCGHPVIKHSHNSNIKYNEYVPDNRSFLQQFSSITCGYGFELK